MDYMALSAAEWQQEYDKVSAEYESWKAKGLKLNMARGKPSKQQLDLVSGILTALTSAEDTGRGVPPYRQSHRRNSGHCADTRRLRPVSD